MQLKYNGPMREIELPPYGRHPKGEIREYPDSFAEELLATSSRQHFERVIQPKGGRPGARKRKDPAAKAAGKNGD